MVRPWNEFSSAMTMDFSGSAGSVAGSTHQFQCAFDGLRTAIGEERPVEPRLAAKFFSK